MTSDAVLLGWGVFVASSFYSTFVWLSAHLVLFSCCERLDDKQPFTTNKVELHFVCCVELGHAVSPITHISSQLLCVTFHLLPSPSIHYSAWLVRLSTSCFSRSLNLTPPTPRPHHPQTPPPPFKASSVVLHLLFLLESLTHLINNTHTSQSHTQK